MNWDFIIKYIENSEQYSYKEASKIINNFIKQEFENTTIEDYTNPMYILVMLKIKEVEYNQFNYYNEYSEIEARKAGAEKLKDFLLSISIGLNDVYVLYDRKKYTANEYINMKYMKKKQKIKRLVAMEWNLLLN